jgi:hypothetical protein
MRFEELRCRSRGNTCAVPRPLADKPGRGFPTRRKWIALQQLFLHGEYERSEYEGRAEALLKPCDHCGGRYAFDALPRCPQCRSTRIERGQLILHYD